MDTIQRRMCLMVFAMLIIAALALYIGCTKRRSSSDSTMTPYSVTGLLLLPIANGSELHGEGTIAKCRVCGTSFMTGFVSSEAPAFITQSVKSALVDKVSITYLSNEQRDEMINRIRLVQVGGNLAEQYAAIGREMDADVVFTGTVYHFKQRDGNDYAVATPATVGVHFDLIESKSGRVLWTQHFEQTQHALSENLLSVKDFFKRKGKWLTAEDLAEDGIRNVIETLPIIQKK